MTRVSSLTAVPYIVAIYEHDLAGCCLHIVTDDGNVETSHVQWCLEYAQQNSCQQCIDCAKAMLPLTVTALKKAIDLAMKKVDWR